MREMVYLSLSDEQFKQLSVDSSDGVIITGDDWFDQKERELLESG